MNHAALSPYHLTTRDVPAMAALLLAGRVTTLLPTPLSGETRDSLREAIDHAPRYRRLLNNWLALTPLFNAGIIQTLGEGKDPAEAVRSAAQRIDDEQAWDPLRPFTRSEVFADPDQYLDALSADLLKGGPDPGIALPACAGLDAFAAELGLPVFRAGHADSARPTRAGSGSLAQQVEQRLGESLCSVGLPILRQASAAAILKARAALAPQLAALRNAVEAVTLNPSAAAGQSVRKAGSTYASAFKSVMTDRLNRDDEAGRRLVPAFVSLNVRRVTADAVLVSSVAALSRAAGPGLRAPSLNARTQTPPAPLITLTITPLEVEPL